MTTSIASSFDVIAERYLAFLRNPHAGPEIHVALCHTDSDTLLTQHKLFQALVSGEADDVALVLQPRRFGAMHLADRYARYTNTVLGHEVGLTGVRGANKESYCRGDHCVIVANYGHALNHERGMMYDASVIVMVNTQERTSTASLVKAAVKHRILANERLFLVLLAATETQFRAECQYYQHENLHAHWLDSDVAPQFDTLFSRPETSVADAVITMLDSGAVQRGIVACVVDQVAAGKVQNRLMDFVTRRGLTNIQWAALHNRLSIEDMRRTLEAPEPGTIRIILNVSTLEASGLHVNWADHIVSDGLRKQYVTSALSGGSDATQVDATTQQIDQQREISGWDQPAAYHLCSTLSYEERQQTVPADLELLPHTDILLQMVEAQLDPYTLDLDAGQISEGDLRAAESRLVELGFIERQLVAEDEPRSYVLGLTAGGAQIQHLQIGILSKAVLMAAYQLDIVAEILPLVAVMESGGVRKWTMRPHGLDRESDLLDTTTAFSKGLLLQGARQTKATDYEAMNVNPRRVQSTWRLLETLRDRSRVDCNLTIWREDGGVARSNPELRRKIKACLFVASIRSLFRSEAGGRQRRHWTSVNDKAHAFGSASIVSGLKNEEPFSVVSGQLKEIMLRNPDRTAVILEHGTAYGDEELCFAAQAFPHLVRMTTPDKRRRVALYRGSFWLGQFTLPVEPVAPPAQPVVEDLAIETATGEVIKLVSLTPEQPFSPILVDTTPVETIAPASQITIPEQIVTAPKKEKPAKSSPSLAEKGIGGTGDAAMLSNLAQLANRWGGSLTVKN